MMTVRCLDCKKVQVNRRASETGEEFVAPCRRCGGLYAINPDEPR